MDESLLETGHADLRQCDHVEAVAMKLSGIGRGSSPESAPCQQGRRAGMAPDA